MVRTGGSAYIYVVVPKEQVNLGPKNVDSSYVKTCSISPQNNVSRVITSPNAFLILTGREPSGRCGGARVRGMDRLTQPHAPGSHQAAAGAQGYGGQTG